MHKAFDLVIIGAGILGLAHALHAARRGLKVAVLDRDAQANGASIRNFGFVTVTGQAAHKTWERARRSRDLWAEVAPRRQRPARIPGQPDGCILPFAGRGRHPRATPLRGPPCCTAQPV
jgi:glycine/D-amino acid oxidase-like deaminating enzyme